MDLLKLICVAGARQNFMKIAPLLQLLREQPRVLPVLVHTGQHFDDAMSDAFFRDLDMAPPDHHLGVGAGTHAEQTARVMERFDAVLRTARYMGGVSRMLELTRVVPTPIRDAAYRLVARHRHRLGHHHPQCLVPTEAERARFLD